MADRPRLLVIIGSGELAPRMARVQRDIVGRLRDAEGGNAPLTGAVIDTPYAFQANAQETSSALADFHRVRLGLPTSLAPIRGRDERLPAEERRRADAALGILRDAAYVFSGPGSPSYALRHWSASSLPALLADKLATGGAIVFASAAALTLGRVVVPVYEIYKAGADPHWLPGLDLLGRVGVNAAVVPHYDNAEGTGHDTRYCFIGERRLRMLEERLPPDTFILGVDEHTAVVLDLDDGSALVEGRGHVTLRSRGESQRLAAGARISIDELRHAGRGATPTASSSVSIGVGTPQSEAGVAPDAEDALFSRLLDAQREAQTLAERANLVEPLLDTLLELRAQARARGDWQTADAIRTRLAELGIELGDASDGTSRASERRLSRSS